MAQSRRWLTMALRLAAVAGCAREEQEPRAAADAPLLYDVADYEMAEGAVIGQERARLHRQQIELRGLWLGLRPMADGPLRRYADVDVLSEPERAEEISQMVAQIALDALPRHDSIRVRVYWWSDEPGDTYAHAAGAWTWDARGDLIEYEEPLNPEREREK